MTSEQARGMRRSPK